MEKIALQGICYDAGSSYLRGPAQAPPLIRSAYCSPSSNFYAEDGLEVHPGIFRDSEDHSMTDYLSIEAITRQTLGNKMPLISLGGDHSISYPILKAIHSIYGPLQLLHIDAHADLYEEFDGNPYSHACPFARIMEDGLASKLVQLGIRTLNRHQQEQADRYGVEQYGAGELPSFSELGLSGPLYISLDLDALDPAYAPGVSHMEPGGFSSRQIINLLQQVDAPVVGADLVEYNPERDINGMTAMVAAKLFKELAAAIVRNPKFES